MKRLHAVQPSQEFIECDFEEFESFNPSTSNTHKHTRNHNDVQIRQKAVDTILDIRTVHHLYRLKFAHLIFLQ